MGLLSCHRRDTSPSVKDQAGSRPAVYESRGTSPAFEDLCRSTRSDYLSERLRLAFCTSSFVGADLSVREVAQVVEHPIEEGRLMSDPLQPPPSQPASWESVAIISWGQHDDERGRKAHD
jgi:hypothetical protein